MALIANILIAYVAISHLGFLFLEIFYWTKPLGLKIFRMTEEHARATAVLAANQGIYNGFLTAGLIWSCIQPIPEIAFQLKVFFLSCVVIAGLYGGFTVHKRVIAIQAAPALLALLFLFFA